jgi:iron(III) transport system substrate-binding protein
MTVRQMRGLLLAPSWRVAARIFAACALLLAWSASPMVAQDQASTGANIATYTGADRMQKLIEGAKKEGTLTLYTSAAVEDIKVLNDAFEKKYGVKTEVWRASGENIIQRSAVEARGNRFDVDVFETDGPVMESLHREKLLQELKSPILANLAPGAIQSHKEWIGDRLQIFSAAYNTNLVKKADLPKTYEDLLDPKWKGKLGIEAADNDWLQGIVTSIGEEKGLKLFREIVAKNGISVRKGHTLLANLVISGEVPLALTTYLYKVQQLKNDGAPIEPLALPPDLGRFQGTGVAKHAPHPYAAVLFVEWLLSDGQQILAQRDFFPANIKVKPLPNLPLKFIDAAKVLDENEKWEKLFKEIVLNQSR